MTKLEALAKDCIENHTHRLIDRPSKQDIYTREESIYISGYKECERQNKNKITELEQKLEQTEKDLTDYQFNYPKIKDLEKENAELKSLVEKYRQAVDKCLHITFMGGGCEVHTTGQYATLVDGYLTDVEGLAKWKD